MGSRSSTSPSCLLLFHSQLAFLYTVLTRWLTPPSVCIASLVLIILATKLDMHSSEITYDMSGIIIPATIEVNFAIVSGKHEMSTVVGLPPMTVQSNTKLIFQ